MIADSLRLGRPEVLVFAAMASDVRQQFDVLLPDLSAVARRTFYPKGRVLIIHRQVDDPAADRAVVLDDDLHAIVRKLPRIGQAVVFSFEPIVDQLVWNELVSGKNSSSMRMLGLPLLIDLYHLSPHGFEMRRVAADPEEHKLAFK